MPSRTKVCRRHPIRVGAKGVERGGGGFLALVGEEVNERVVGALLAFHRRPVADVFHAVLGEECEGVVAETGVERVEVAGGGGVDAQLEHARFLGGRGFDGRRVISGVEEQGFDLGDELAVGLGFLLRLLPIRISSESGP